jgi:hypothetical protein
MSNAQPNGAVTGCPIPLNGHVHVTRGPDDSRTVLVPVASLRNPHMATDCGGRIAALAQPTLAAYMNCDLVPVGAPFGHDCAHGAGPHSIKVLIREQDNAPGPLAHLRERAAAFKPRRTRPARIEQSMRAAA